MKIINTRLNLAEKLLLIVWNRNLKTIPIIFRPKLGEALKIALIEDLKLQGKLSFEYSKINIINDSPTEDPLLDDMMGDLIAKRSPFIRQEFIWRVFDQLVARGVFSVRLAKLGRVYELKDNAIRGAIIDDIKSFIAGKSAEDKELPILITLCDSRLALLSKMPLNLWMDTLGKKTLVVSKPDIEGMLLHKINPEVSRFKEDAMIASNKQNLSESALNEDIKEIKEDIRTLRKENNIDHTWGRLKIDKVENKLSAKIDGNTTYITAMMDAQVSTTTDLFEENNQKAEENLKELDQKIHETVKELEQEIKHDSRSTQDLIEKLDKDNAINFEMIIKKIDLNTALHPNELEKLFVMLQLCLKKAKPVMERIEDEIGSIIDESRAMLYSEEEWLQLMNDTEKKIIEAGNDIITKDEEELFLLTTSIAKYISMAQEPRRIVDFERMQLNPKLRHLYHLLDNHPAGKKTWMTIKTACQAIPLASLLSTVLKGVV